MRAFSREYKKITASMMFISKSELKYCLYLCMERKQFL